MKMKVYKWAVGGVDFTTVERNVEVPEKMTEVIFWYENAGHLTHKMATGYWLPGEEYFFAYSPEHSGLYKTCIGRCDVVPIEDYIKKAERLEKALKKAEAKIIGLKKKSKIN